MTSPRPDRFDFAFAPSYRVPALLLGITGSTAWAELGPDALTVRFGLWRLRTPLANVAAVHRTGDFAFLKTAGPPHLSFADRGVTFATNGDQAVCLTFHQPVPAIDPTRRITHPGATLTLRDLDRFEVELADLTGVARA
ncbi:hypothetical protein [Nocardioides rubriscoriae]|uniref:hypothetical protein n=1 Tax=Nocardioides rubriscoriae TaxID=642762 RepID=UPI0011DF47B1|nr:hypothetical protein [Nocardioides rubriscoriae]